MNTRMMVGAFLRCGNKVLLIHRGTHKKIAPGMWSCVGGHMEPHELNAPLAACLREVAEETGIQGEDISALRLRYITVRHTGEEIRTGYYFTGSLSREHELSYCGEGSLHWVDIGDIQGLPMTFSIKQVTARWLTDPYGEDIFLCGINRENNEITFLPLY